MHISVLTLFLLFSILVYVKTKKWYFRDSDSEILELFVYFSSTILGLLTITVKVCKLLWAFIFILSKYYV